MVRALERPWVVGLVALSTAVVFVIARLAFATSDDITRFIIVGSTFVVGHGLPHGIHVVPGTGYDGQFYYRQALSPFEVSSVAHGIRLDGTFRLQRLGYPLVAYVLSFGQGGLVPYTLVVTNIVGLGLVACLGARLAQELGRSAVYGLILAGYFGFVTTLGRDLTEITEAVLLLAGVLAYRRQYYVLAALAFAGAVVTRETEVFAVAGYGVVLVVRAIAAPRSGRAAPPWRAHLIWVLPAAAFAGVQLWIYEATGHVAGSSGASSNFGTPLLTPLRAVEMYAPHPFVLANAIWLAELAILVLVVVLALACLWRTEALTEERTALLFLAGLALCLASGIWDGQVDFRSLAPLFEMATVVLLGSRLRLGLLAAIVAVAFLVTFVHRVRFL